MNNRKKRYAKKLLVLCILFSLLLTTCGAKFSLENRNLAEPENPLGEVLEDDKQITASTLEEYLPQSQELQQEREKDQENKTNDSDKSSGKTDKNGKSDQKKDGTAADGQGDEQNIKEGDGEGNNWFTTSITDGEIVTVADYEFEVIQLQTEVPIVDQQIYLNGESWPGFQNHGIVTLSEGENTIKVTCTYQREGEDEFSISRSYTVYLESERIVIYTDLQDDMTISEADFAFTAYARYQGNDVPVTITVNKSTCSETEENVYAVRLQNGSNTIKIAASYEGMNREETYQITLDLKGATIVTDLDNRDLEVDEPTFLFYASLLMSDESQKKLTVKFNGQIIEDVSDFEYSVTLEEGINTIVLDPSNTNPYMEAQTYNVAYFAPASGLEVRTDLVDGWETQSPSFTFLAYALSNQGKAELTVKLEDKTVKAGSNHYYKVTLAEGENLIHLKASDGVEDLSYSFSIYYNPVGKDEPPADSGDDGKDDGKNDKDDGDVDTEKLPILKTSLLDGQTIKGKYKNFNVWLTDYQGNILTSDYLLVKLNGSRKNVSILREDARNNHRITYRVLLQEGENTLTFTLVDDEGNEATYQIKVYCEYAKDGEPIGKVIISVLARPYNIGYIIPAQKVDIYDGDNACTVLKRVLEADGYECIGQGTAEAFYFVGIGNLNVANGSLSAGDFGSLSGWMYQWNGEVPNYGMGAAILEDGDTINIAYTIDGGRDLGWD